MRNYKIHWGRLLGLRWFAASWLLHGVHVWDRTERFYYICAEVLLYAILIAPLALCGVTAWWAYALVFVVLHTATWLLDSSWLVGYREVDLNFHGKGIGSVIDYARLCRSRLSRFPEVVAIGIYGSMSRRKFHDRSDLDFRVVQTGHSLALFWEVQKLRCIGIWRYRIPLDMKLVDSFEYLKKEMRADEKAVVVYKTVETFYNEGVAFEELEQHPEAFLRSEA